MSHLSEIVARALTAISEGRDEAELERIRVEFLGRKSAIAETFGSLRTISSAPVRIQVAQDANQAKASIEAALAARTSALERDRLANLAQSETIDVTFPGRPPATGRLHPLTLVQRDIETVMETMGYHVELGPEVETDWYNFEALNLAPGHAARDMQDTFFFDSSESLLLRTHTSPMQIRSMERLKQPPIYVIIPGRCYRRDATDPTHVAQFMQVEALAIDEGITVGDLKGTILYFAQSLWGPDRRIQIRPNFFPYTEPSFEFDLSCGVCDGRGEVGDSPGSSRAPTGGSPPNRACRSCGGTGWLEVGGCGMVHPNVLRNGGIDPERYTGFAWGFGIERIAMLRHDVDDIRHFYDNDLRFLEQLA
jgi:phenylalanyl-tRNA synthetase alpha chain